MKRLFVLILVLTGCASVNMWIPIEQTSRPPVPLAHVQYLQSVPERPYSEIGIITPPADEYETEAEAIMAIRTEAAKHGADAILVESQTATSGWGFSGGMYGASGGSSDGVIYRVKAIVWK